ncbi:MAG: DUF305 domain-containing protein [Solirubrobacterales bacterium]
MTARGSGAGGRKRRLAGWALALGSLAFVAMVVSSLAPNSERRGTIEADGAFLAGMGAHERMGERMARIAALEARRPQLRRLAAAMARKGGEEAVLNGAHLRLFNADLPLRAGLHGGGLMPSIETPTAEDLLRLRRTRPFDRTFLDMFAAHQRDAVRLARAEVGKGLDPEIVELARGDAAAHSRSIVAVSRWRADWYGTRLEQSQGE